ncbi:hypothetical protein M947_04085 [Sulfurimonas hongkongensis]|uniref:Aromatic hydrocarbon degradation protein n=1 Tax=Sulfurimonas hongkongensis TaxID=1172190 RepID=T0JNT0_9BACT|nr:outer membrane protein transport protein [Sulfurimonas hongkongensis]EQB39761.1 hypothetical protein M947_04085 [Sulfurimonas hongkongensis]
MKKVVLSSLMTSSMLMAGGYKTPENSLNAVALSAANIAHNKSADAAYYNPANMVFMEDKHIVELDLTYIGLDRVEYRGKVSSSGSYSLESKKESFIVPNLHYVSGRAGETRIGLSIVVPAGLSKRWQSEPAKTSAEEFTLEVIEINPTVAIPVNDKLSVAFGFRIVHTSGVVKSDGTALVGPSTYSKITRDMTGDGISYGYNLALAYKPTNELELATTYRSKVNLNSEGNAKLSSLLDGATYNGGGEVFVPLPALFSAAVAYTLPSQTTIELVYERVMWSAYKDLDFDYDGALNSAILIGAFDNAKPKNWKDTNTFRLGITQELDTMTLMAGVVYDESPAPDATIGFELPDSNSFALSFGGRYKIGDSMEVGLATLYSMRENRKIRSSTLDGEFSGGDVLIVSTGLSYKF